VKQTENKTKQILTISQAAQPLGVCAGTLRYWDQSGKLQPIRHPLNGYRLYSRKTLEGLLLKIRDGGVGDKLERLSE